MAETHLPGTNLIDVKISDDKELISFLDSFNLKLSMDKIWEYISTTDQIIQSELPFKLVKTDPETGKKIIAGLVGNLKLVAKFLEPFLPDTSQKIQELIKQNKKPEKPLFLRKE